MTDQLVDDLRSLFERRYFPAHGDLGAKVHARLGGSGRGRYRIGRSRPTLTVAVLIGTALAVAAPILASRIVGGLSAPRPVSNIPLHRPTATPAPSSQPTPGTFPATFVGDMHPGLALYDSTSGRLARVLTTGPDQFPSVTGDGKTVYFLRCSCGSATDGIWRVSTNGGPASLVIRQKGQDVLLEPTVSIDGRMLAWQMSTVRKSGVALYVRDLKTGTQRAIAIAPNFGVDFLSWAPDDRHLLYTIADIVPSVELLDTATAASTSEAVHLQTTACGEFWPRFLPDGTFAALTCSPSGSGDVVAGFDQSSGRMLRVLQSGIPLAPVGGEAAAFNPTWLAISPDGTSAIWTSVARGSDVWLWNGVRATQLPVFAEEVSW